MIVKGSMIVYLNTTNLIMYLFLACQRSKGRNASNGSSKDEPMDIVRAFVRIDSFEVHHVPNDIVLIRNSIASKLDTRTEKMNKVKKSGGVMRRRTKAKDTFRYVPYHGRF